MEGTISLNLTVFVFSEISWFVEHQSGFAEALAVYVGTNALDVHVMSFLPGFHPKTGEGGVTVVLQFDVPESLADVIMTALMQDASLLALLDLRGLKPARVLTVEAFCAQNSYISVLWRVCVPCPSGSTAPFRSDKLADCTCAAGTGSACFPKVLPNSELGDGFIGLQIILRVLATEEWVHDNSDALAGAFADFLSLDKSAFEVILPQLSPASRRLEQLRNLTFSEEDTVEFTMKIQVPITVGLPAMDALESGGSLLSFLESAGLKPVQVIGVVKFCPPGLIPQGPVSACQECAADSYASAVWEQCVPCPIGSNSVAGSANLSDCECQRGTGWDCTPDPPQAGYQLPLELQPRVVLSTTLRIEGTLVEFRATQDDYVATLAAFLGVDASQITVISATEILLTDGATGVVAIVAVEVQESFVEQAIMYLEVDAALLAFLEAAGLKPAFVLSITVSDGCAANNYYSELWKICVRCPDGSTAPSASQNLSSCSCAKGRGYDCVQGIADDSSELPDLEGRLSLNVSLMVRATISDFEGSKDRLVEGIAKYLGLNTSDVSLVYASGSQARRRLTAGEKIILVVLQIEADASLADRLIRYLELGWSLLAFLESEKLLPAYVVDINTYCDVGRVPTDAGKSCIDCQASTYASKGWSRCVPCPMDSTAPPRSADMDSCKCAAGSGSACFPKFAQNNTAGRTEKDVGLNVSLVMSPATMADFEGSREAFIRALAEYLGLDISSIHIVYFVPGNSSDGVPYVMVIVEARVPASVAEMAADAVQNDGSLPALLEKAGVPPTTITGVQTFCPDGAFSLSEGGPCSQCPADQYASLRWDMCIDCPDGAWSEKGSLSLEDCTCEAGSGQQCMPPHREAAAVSPLEERVLLNITMILGISKAEFEANMDSYIAALAAYLGVNPEDIVIVSITEVFVAALGEWGIVVEMNIDVPKTMAKAAVSALKLDASLLAFLEAAGLQPGWLATVNEAEGCSAN
eukprot:581849-Rhodomonas_salina.1